MTSDDEVDAAFAKSRAAIGQERILVNCAGVGGSIKTVSRVMNNEPNVREETRIRVRDAARLLNYQPNLLARSLASSRSFLVALLYDNPNPSYISDIQMGAIERARQSSYHLLCEPQSGSDAELEAGIRSLLSTIRLDGVVLTPPLTDNLVVLRTLESAGVAYVRVSPRDESNQSAPLVAMDDQKAAYDITRHLIVNGHRDIGIIKGHIQHGSSVRRYEGFIDALNEARIHPNPDWIGQGDYSYESGVEAGLMLLAEGKARPTAIFSSNDYMAFGLMTVAQQKGIAIPQDLSVAGFDDVPGATRTWPPLTTIQQPVFDLGFEAVEMLLSRHAEAESKVKSTKYLPYRLIERDSTRAL